VALWTLCTAGAAAAAGGQDPDTPALYQLVLRDGSRVYGSIEKESVDEVVLRTASGVLVTAERAQIDELKPARGRIVSGEFQRADPTPTRLFFAPTGRQLKKGEAYFGVYDILMPTLQVGVTNRFSIGGGTPLIFFGDGDDGWERPFWVTPKLQLVDTGRVQVAAGVFHGMNLDGDAGGIAYAVATTGSQSASITGGAGMAYAGDGSRSFVLMLGGDRQIARSVKVITENYVWKGGDGIISFGFRFFGEQLSADVGLATPIGAEDFFLFPVVNFVYSF
jgi:hypothetical protein